MRTALPLVPSLKLAAPLVKKDLPVALQQPGWDGTLTVCEHQLHAVKEKTKLHLACKYIFFFSFPGQNKEAAAHCQNAVFPSLRAPPGAAEQAAGSRLSL